jgi:hypothetical protein
MDRPTLEQQQYYRRNSELLIQQTREIINTRIAQKRWEFQHTDFNPLHLWQIANDVEALSWVLRKLNILLRQDRPFSDYSLESLITTLKKAVVKIDKYLDKHSKDNSDFSESDKLKSRASMIEWCLFQVHFLSTNMHR